MNGKSSCNGIASAMAILYQALLFLLLSASILGAGGLEANEYGEIDETPTNTELITSEDVAVLSDSFEKIGTEGATTLESTESEEISASSDPTLSSGENATTEIDSAETATTGETNVIEEVVVEAEPTTAEAVVYVFNNDDDTLSISLFIDSELKDTEDVSKEKEKKFGNYQLEGGSHKFKITWWDDDTKKTHEEELIATIEDETAVTLYATQNKEPEEFEVSVMLRNDNQEDLEAYLYIDGEYEKQKTAKKESTTDFGKFDLEEGTHELSVRWQDPDTNIEYEKKKTIRIDGTDVVTFYAPKGMTFESADEKAASTATTPKTTTSSKTATTSTKTTSTSTTTKDDGENEGTSSQTGGSDTKLASSTSGDVKASTDKAKTNQEDETPSGDKSKQTPTEKDGGDGPDVTNATLYLSTIGAIIVIYIIFFRR